MEQTFQALSSILLKAIPTAVLLLVLYFYLKATFFGPIAKILKQREQLTGGAKKTAEQSLVNAERKATEYQTKLRDAHNEVYKEQEETRRKWLEQQTAQIAEAKTQSEASVKTARAAIAQEAAAARQGLEQSSAALAEQIASAVLARRSL